MYFTVPGQPVGKGRPRASHIAGHIRMRTPKKTKSYEAFVALCARDAGVPIEAGVPIIVTLTAVCRRPQRLCRKRDPVHRLPCLTKPDIDNVCKAVVDGIVLGGAIADDKDVIHLVATKMYAAIGEDPHVEVTIKPWLA